jgi:hypothetical protein
MKLKEIGVGRYYALALGGRGSVEVFDVRRVRVLETGLAYFKDADGVVHRAGHSDLVVVQACDVPWIRNGLLDDKHERHCVWALSAKFFLMTWRAYTIKFRDDIAKWRKILRRHQVDELRHDRAAKRFYELTGFGKRAIVYAFPNHPVELSLTLEELEHINSLLSGKRKRR